MRAVAVSMVVLYHVWPERLPGGYAGVDAFFVVSGFLISGHLTRAIESRTFSFSAFYARRARRLLPAALAVLVFVVIAVCILYPRTSWSSIGAQIIASALYFENWTLAQAAVDYLAASGAESPVQHYWSLSVEEQFYIAWPALLVLASATAVVLRRRFRSVALGLVVTLTGGSFLYGAWLSVTVPSTAYFSTFTRAWEFGAGAILALLGSRAAPSRQRVRRLAFAAGLIGLLASCFLLNASTVFPGYAAALPVIATCLVIASGDVAMPHGRIPFPPHARAVQWLGGVSYSVYLWHWPLLLILPVIIGRLVALPDLVTKLIVLLVTAAAGWLSKTWIEDRVRLVPWRLLRTTRRTALAAVSATALVLAAGAVPFTANLAPVNAANTSLEKFVAHPPQCFGAMAQFRELHCGVKTGDEGRGTFQPAAIIASTDAPSTQGCQQSISRSFLLSCTVDRGDRLKVAVVGDSHANMWIPALTVLAERNGWSIDTFLKSSCPFSSNPTNDPSCASWNAALSQRLASQHYDYVITSSSVGDPYLDASAAAVARGFETAWRPIAATSPVVVLQDIPQPRLAGIGDIPSCVSTEAPEHCAFKTTPSSAGQGLETAARESQGVSWVPTASYFSRTTAVQPVVGGVLVYRDGEHMTALYSQSIGRAALALPSLPGLGTLLDLH